MLNGLELPDRLAESLTLDRILVGFLKAALCETDADGGANDTLVVERSQQVVPALAACAKD